MASTRQKAKAKTFSVRRVESKEARKRPSVFMRLKVDEAFKGVALFEPDPELEDNPGYFEYYDHFDKQGNSYVPCAGEYCPFCAANDNPSTRALTAWYFPDAADKKDQIKVFTMNYSTTQEITDEAEDEDGLIGKVVRIKRLEPVEKGNYRVKITADKALSKTQLKSVMSQLTEQFPDGLEGLVERQLKAQMERLKALEAMEDDEDDDEETTSRARRGKRRDEEPEDEADEDEDEEEEDDEEETEAEDEEESEELVALTSQEVEILRVSRKNNSISVEVNDETLELIADEDEIDVSDFKKGETVVVDAEYDEDEEAWALTSISTAEAEEEEEEEAEEDEDEEEEAEEEDSEDEAEEISGGVYEVLKVQEKDEIFDLQDEDGTKVKMWLGDGLEVDYEEIKKGVKVTIDAVPDDEGDWIILKIEAEAPKPPARRRSGTKTKTASTRKTATTRKTTSTRKTGGTSRNRKR